MRTIIIVLFFVSSVFASETNLFRPFIVVDAKPLMTSKDILDYNNRKLIDSSKAATITNGITLGQVATNLGPGVVSLASGVGNIVWEFSDGRCLLVNHCRDANIILSSDAHARYHFWFVTNATMYITNAAVLPKK